MCKSKRSAFRQEKFDNMDKALFDTEELWKQFKHFSENRMPKCTASEKISAQNWKKNFQRPVDPFNCRKSRLKKPKQAL